MTRFACIPLFCILTACTSTPVSKPAVEAKPKVSIDQFYSPTPHIEKGGKATLCYGVTFAREVALAPAAANVWPAVSRCVDVTPAKSTTYSLTAKGAEGDVVTKTALVEVGPPHAKIFDIWASGVDQQAG